MAPNKYSLRIEALRSLMRERGWDAVILGGSDPHASEYPAPRWKQVEWLTGFTGEAGDVVITLDHAGLWTDTRYFIQADRQLAGTGVELHKTRVPEQVLIPEWLAGQTPRTGRGVTQSSCPANAGHLYTVAFDGLCQSVGFVDELRQAFGGEVRLVSEPDLLSVLWTDRPPVPETPIYTLPDAVTGESRARKLAWLRGWLKEHGLDAILLTALDEIAWLLNIRASDVEYNPVAISYLLVTGDRACWYVRKEPSQDGIPDLEDVTVKDYTAIAQDLLHLSGRLCLDPASLNYHLRSLTAGDPVFCPSPVPLRKAVKNPVEIEGMVRRHIEDGVAMEKYLFWLEQHFGRTDERTAADRLQAFRAEIDGYCGDSFETISAWGPGAALPHYVTPKTDAPQIEAHGLYLVDSGGQYLGGTTDITRTVPCGPCTELEREDYTLVLKGHIALSMAVFPAGTPGCRIDALAREPLWRCRRNFGHGTGHGVGSFLGVHEGPQDVRQNLNPQPLVPGMVVSVEPGIYREGQHGVRHENLVLVRDLGTNEFGTWYGFEPLTLCHYDTSILARDLLNREETDWLNAYNERVYQTLSPRLPAEITAWLREKTKAL